MLNYDAKKKICICADVYMLYEGDDNDQLFESLSTRKI